MGGGTDYPQWYLQNGGQVLATSIAQYCHISVRYLPPFFNYKHRVVYSKTEQVNRIEEIDHPAVRAVLNWAGGDARSYEIHHDGDVPARSGLGSSSAFTVGLINAVMALRGEYIGRKGLAFRAHEIEQRILKENVGSQDQICAAYGGFNRVIFNKDGSFDVLPVILGGERLREVESSMMLVFTGMSRIADEIAKSKIDNFPTKKEALWELSTLVSEGIKILGNATIPMSEFGKLLTHSWNLKKSLSEKVSNDHIDSVFSRAMSCGAWGGKLLGAGGGGFLLICADRQTQAKIRETLSHDDLVHVPFKFDRSGSKIVHFEPEQH